MWIIKIFKSKCFYPPRIYSCLQIPPRVNWFQYVRRVYTTAINFHCITTLLKFMSVYAVSVQSLENKQTRIFTILQSQSIGLFIRSILVILKHKKNLEKLKFIIFKRSETTNGQFKYFKNDKINLDGKREVQSSLYRINTMKTTFNFDFYQII